MSVSDWLEHPPGPIGWLSRATEGWGSDGNEGGTYNCGKCGAENDYGEACPCMTAWDEAHGL